MTLIAPSRTLIQQEEVDSPAGVTTTTFKRMGETMNMISLRQYDSHQFHFNKLFRKLMTTQGRDGIFPILFNMEIIGITLWQRKLGSSGITDIDLLWLNVSGTIQGSIFSTTPKFTTAVGNNAYMIRDFANATTKAIPASGATLPVLSKTNFDEGNAIIARINDAQFGAEDCSIIINFRPR